MSNPTWDGVEIDYSALAGFGWYNTQITVNGTAYPLLLGYQVAGLREMDARIAASGGGAFGARFTCDLTSTADSDPGAGKLKFNNATPASATVIYVDLTDAGGTDITALLDALDDSSSTLKGSLSLRAADDPNVWLTFSLSAVTTATGYRKLTAAYVAGPGGFASGDTILLGFAPKGDKGDTGDAGTAASESTAGVAEIATQPETDAGSDDARFVTPLKHKANIDGRLATAAEAEAGTSTSKLLTPSAFLTAARRIATRMALTA